MPVIHIPAHLRRLTGDRSSVTVEGTTLRQAIDALEAAHPGLRAMIVQDGALRPEVALAVDGAVIEGGLHQPIAANAEIYIVPAISGGG